jgi:hypothetical protein
MNNTNNSISSAAEPIKSNKTDYSNPYVRMQSKLSPNAGASGANTGTYQRLSLGNDAKVNDMRSTAEADASGSGTIGTRSDSISMTDSRLKRNHHKGSS